MPLPFTLNEHEARVLGALIEKERTTPEYYPLSLNALAAACNQKSNREPVMTLGEDDVRLALRNLQEKRLAESVQDGRVPKWRHTLPEVFNLTRGQSALICVLLLRGAQTPGELRGRSERMYDFVELTDVEAALRQLMEHDPPLAAALARVPGTREQRYATTLVAGNPVASFEFPVASAPEHPQAPTLADRVARLEAEIAELRQRLDRLTANG